MTDETNIALSDRGSTAFEIEKKVIEAKQQATAGLWELAKNLKEIRDNAYYTELGYDTITEWLSSPEIDITASWAWAFMDMYDVYVIQHGLSHASLLGTDYTKLRQILPIVKQNPEQVDEWLEKAKTLRRIDLSKEVKEHKVNERQQLVEDTEPEVTSYGNLLNKSAQMFLGSATGPIADCIITTPPHINIASPTLVAGSILSSEQGVYQFHQNWLQEAYKALAPTGSMFLVCDHHTLFILGHMLKVTGFKLIRDIVWKHKKDIPVSVNTLMHMHDTILWASKGDKYMNNAIEIESDVWEFDAKRAYEHPQDQPEMLIERLIGLATDPSQMVVDPFAAAGTTLAVAKRMRRNFFGAEEDEYWHSVGVKRLTQPV